MKVWVLRAALAAALLLTVALPAWADGGNEGDSLTPALWTTVLAWLVPIGLGLVACGTVPPTQVSSVIWLGWLALGVAVIGYWLCGFAFQFGAVGFLPGQHPELAGLVRQWNWSPFDPEWGVEWGVIGLEGYALQGGASTPAAQWLFISQLPWITTAIAVPLWSLQGRTRPLVLLLSAILAGLLYTVFGNWTWGGGWLSSLGLNLNLGHGLVDYAGTGAVHLVGAAAALAGMLALGVRSLVHPPARQLALPTMADGSRPGTQHTPEGGSYIPMPPLHMPVLATLGAWLALVGWIGWCASTPAHTGMGLTAPAQDNLAQTASLFLAAAGGSLAASLFGWLTTGAANALMTARGVIAALVAVSAGLPFYPLWGALAIGATAGLLVPLVQYTIEHLLRLDDPTAVVATHGMPALWGLLAVGLLANGQTGQGWNQIGPQAYLGVEGQGISGYVVSPGYASDWPTQFQAQAIGLAAMAIIAFLGFWLLYALVQGLGRAWQGEYTLRLPRRPQRRAAGASTTRLRWPKIQIVRPSPKPVQPDIDVIDQSKSETNEQPAPRPPRAWRRLEAWIAERRKAEPAVQTAASSVDTEGEDQNAEPREPA